VLKGILTAEDAALAEQAGASAVVVSNHGARQLDGCVPSAVALREVVAELEGRLPVLVDGGIRSGGDVVRALALGADAVMVGRPYLWGLAAGGEPGVLAALEALVTDTATTLALVGAATPAHVDPGPRAPQGLVNCPLRAGKASSNVLVCRAKTQNVGICGNGERDLCALRSSALQPPSALWLVLLLGSGKRQDDEGEPRDGEGSDGRQEGLLRAVLLPLQHALRARARRALRDVPPGHPRGLRPPQQMRFVSAPSAAPRPPGRSPAPGAGRAARRLSGRLRRAASPPGRLERTGQAARRRSRP
jgi:hypothetical protein